jgi:hypothetical protein
VLIQQRWLPVALAALAMISPAFCPKLAGRLSPPIRWRSTGAARGAHHRDAVVSERLRDGGHTAAIAGYSCASNDYKVAQLEKLRYLAEITFHCGVLRSIIMAWGSQFQ